MKRPRPASLAFHVHSRTLPARSATPKRFMLFVLPTGSGPLPDRLDIGMIRELPTVKATRFQWKTVGRLLPAHSAYAAASYQLTPETGYSACPSGEEPTSQGAGPGRPVRSTNRPIASFDVSARFPSTNGCLQCFGSV